MENSEIIIFWIVFNGVINQNRGIVFFSRVPTYFISVLFLFHRGKPITNRTRRQFPFRFQFFLITFVHWSINARIERKPISRDLYFDCKTIFPLILRLCWLGSHSHARSHTSRAVDKHLTLFVSRGRVSERTNNSLICFGILLYIDKFSIQYHHYRQTSDEPMSLSLSRCLLLPIFWFLSPFLSTHVKWSIMDFIYRSLSPALVRANKKNADGKSFSTYTHARVHSTQIHPRDLIKPK